MSMYSSHSLYGVAPKSSSVNFLLSLLGLYLYLSTALMSNYGSLNLTYYAAHNLRHYSRLTTVPSVSLMVLFSLHY